MAGESFETLRQALPDWAKDTRVNLGIVSTVSALTPRQAHLVALACAAAGGVERVISCTRGEAAAHLDAAHVDAALGAASVMAMNNVYYRFLHFMAQGAEGDEGKEYAAMPARLRMQLIGRPGIDGLDFELACLAVSAMGGCERCVRAHEHAIRERGGGAAQVHEAVRIASVMAAASTALRAASGVEAAASSAA